MTDPENQTPNEPQGTPPANPQDSAPPAEFDVWSGSPSAKADVAKVLGAAIITVAVIAMAIREPAPWSRLLAYVLAPLAWAWALVNCYYPKLANHYRLTSQRLFVRHGLLTQVTDQLELIRVDDVRVRQSLVQRLMKIGDVLIIGTDATDPASILQSVHGCHEVAELVRQNARQMRQKAIYIENLQYRPEK